MRKFTVRKLSDGCYKLQVYDRWFIFSFLYDTHYSREKEDKGMDEILDIIIEYGKNKRVPEKTINSIGG